MADTIEAGLLSTLSGLLASFNDMLTHMFSSLKDDDLDVKDGRQGKTADGRTAYLCTVYTAKNHEIHVKVVSSAQRENVYDLYMVADNGKKYKKAGIYCPSGEKDNKIGEEIQNFIEQEYGADSENYRLEEGQKDFDLDQPQDDDDTTGFEGQQLTSSQNNDTSTNSSKKLQVTLSKVIGSDEITLGKIYCNYDIDSAYEDLQAITADPNVAAELTEDPSIFEITQDDNEYDVEPIDQISESNAAIIILRAQLTALTKLTVIKADSAFRYQFDDELNEYVWAIRSQLDWITQNTTFLSIHKDRPEELAAFHAALNGPFIDFESEAAIGSVHDIIESYCLTLEMYRGNFDEEVRTLIDSWLLTLRYSR